MGAMLQITRTEHTSAELRALSVKCGDGAQVRRMLALALVLEGRLRGPEFSPPEADRNRHLRPEVTAT